MDVLRLAWLYLWIAPHLLLILVAVLMVRNGRQRDFPIFFSYLLYEFLQFVVIFSIWCLEAPHPMWLRTDEILRGGSVVFRFAMIQEMIAAPFSHSIPMGKIMTRMLNWGTGFLVVISLVSVEYLYRQLPNYGLLKNYVVIEACNITQCGLIVGVFLWHRFLGVRMSPTVFGIALGMGLIVGSEPYMLAFVTGTRLISRDSLQMAVFNVAVLVWLYFVQVREPSDSDFNGAQLLRVRDWAEGVGRITCP
jgi:cytochrome c oxidase subunit IV